MAPPSHQKRSDFVEPDLTAWHESGRWRPAVAFAATFTLWIAAAGIGLWSQHPAVRIAAAAPMTFAAARLFTLGHDAGHGSFSPSARMNAVVGRLALVPSVHVFGLWRLHHDVHHRYTNLRGRDFVWPPLTVAEFRALPRWRRQLHRLYRHRSGLGLGLHYAVEVWGRRMLWPRAKHGRRGNDRLWADSILMYALLGCLAASAWLFVSAVDADRAGDSRYWASAVLLSFLLPLAGTHWLIGFVIYLNHTHPDIVWYDDPAAWSRDRVQLEGSAETRVPSPWPLPRRIMNHTAHHVDPGVPLRLLEDAQRHLTDTFGPRVVAYEWTPRRFRDVLAHCQLYDYETRQWSPFPPAAAEG